MTPQHVEYVFQAIVFLFAISVHESAHAWTASRCGDPTARMLGRVSLNPIRHIDPVGTVLLPALAIIYQLPLFGWAKPTPVDPNNLRNPVRDDIYTSVAGPISNFLIAICSVLVLILIVLVAPGGQRAVTDAITFKYGAGLMFDTNSPLMPFALLVYELLFINVLLGVFNLIPVPPLDGSHVFRHLMSDRVRDIYDRVGIFGLFALVIFGSRVLDRLITPFLNFFNSLLLSFFHG